MDTMSSLIDYVDWSTNRNCPNQGRHSIYMVNGVWSLIYLRGGVGVTSCSKSSFPHNELGRWTFSQVQRYRSTASDWTKPDPGGILTGNHPWIRTMYGK